MNVKVVTVWFDDADDAQWWAGFLCGLGIVEHIEVMSRGHRRRVTWCPKNRKKPVSART